MTRLILNAFHPLPYYRYSFQKRAVLLSACAAAFLAASVPALAHGFAGDRFFPATLATDDPFVANEIVASNVSGDSTTGRSSGKNV
jgi:hypothetical protein